MAAFGLRNVVFVCYEARIAELDESRECTFVVKGKCENRGLYTLGYLLLFLPNQVNQSYPGLVPRCVFWDFNTAGWSEEGCELVKAENSSVTCECNHLTNFAILMVSQGHNSSIINKHMQLCTNATAF